MGASKDKKKQAAKKRQNLVENNSSKNKKNNKAQESVGKGNNSNKQQQQDQVKITFSENGDTIVLKRINDSYVCTNCLEQFNISSNKKNSNGSSFSTVGKVLPNECSVCHIKEIESSSSTSAGKSKNKITNEDEDEDLSNKMEIGDGVKGLDNLGNTCFFNSIMQNLTHLNILRDLFLREPGSSNSKIHTNSQLTMEMYYFFNKMYKSKQSRVSPSGLFSEIAKKSPRFRGFKQQDSHELLRYLLDGLISEEQNTTKRRKDPTYIDKIFGGQLISVITCFHCGYVSKTFEPFLDLSLPIPSNNELNNNMGGGKTRGNNNSQSFVMPRISTPPSNALKKGLTDQDKINEILKAHADSLNSSPVVISSTPPTAARVSKNQKKKLARDQKRKEEKEQEEKDQLPQQDEGEKKVDIAVEEEKEEATNSAMGSPLFGSMEEIHIIANNDNNGVVVELSSLDNQDGTALLEDNNTAIEVVNISDDDEDVPIATYTSPSRETVEVTTIDENSENIEKEIIKTPPTFDTPPTVTTDAQNGNLSLSIIENYETTDSNGGDIPSSNNLQTPSPSTTTNSETNSGHHRSISELEKSFETIKLSNDDSDDEGHSDDSDDEKEDLLKEPIDLRKDIPSQAYNANTLFSCLLQFTNPEKLFGENGFICSNCKKCYKESQEKKEKDKLDKQAAASVASSVESTPELKLQSIEIDKDNLNITTEESPKPVDKKSKKKQLQQAKGKKKQNNKREDQDDNERFRRNASKQYLLSSTPPYLTIQLKRFMQTRMGFQKNSKRIEFPTFLDLTSFTDQTTTNNEDKDKEEKDKEEKEDKENDDKKEEGEEDIRVYKKVNSKLNNHSKNNHKYHLNGIVEHMGGMGSGHYVAYIYEDSNDQWYYISDSVVKPNSLNSVISNEPYLLFYRKDGVKTSDIFNSIQRIVAGNNNNNNNDNFDKNNFPSPPTTIPSDINIKIEKIDKINVPIISDENSITTTPEEKEKEEKPSIIPITSNNNSNMYNSLFDVHDDYEDSSNNTTTITTVNPSSVDIIDMVTISSTSTHDTDNSEITADNSSVSTDFEETASL